MRKILIIIGVILLIVILYWYFFVAEDTTPPEEDMDTEVVFDEDDLPNGGSPTPQEAERVAFGFVQDYIAYVEEGETAADDRIIATLSEEARKEIDRENLSAELAEFFEVNEAPESASVEDLQIISEDEAFLVVGLNYENGRVIRNVYLVVEDDVWVVAEVNGLPETGAFRETGVLIRDTPGLSSDTWHLLYERPGQPTLTVPLEFISTSTCDGKECDSEALVTGTAVTVTGEPTGDTVRVASLRIE